MWMHLACVQWDRQQWRKNVKGFPELIDFCTPTPLHPSFHSFFMARLLQKRVSRVRWLHETTTSPYNHHCSLSFLHILTFFSPRAQQHRGTHPGEARGATSPSTWRRSHQGHRGGRRHDRERALRDIRQEKLQQISARGRWAHNRHTIFMLIFISRG